jgi:hypothetical protein
MEPVAVVKQLIISKLHLQTPAAHSTESPYSQPSESLIIVADIFFILKYIKIIFFLFLK